MLRHRPLQLIVGILAGGLLAGCSTPAPPAPKAPEGGQAAQTAPTTPPAAAASPAQATAAVKASPAVSAAPQAATPSPSPKAATRIEPKGKLTYALHVALSPRWLDPIESGSTLSDFILLGAVHDGLMRPLPGNGYSPSLAESYEIAPDYKSATFKLRQGIKFHNGEPVTPEDVKFTYETYKGANAKALQDKTDRIEIVDNRTIRFLFKVPFPDFQFLYGSYASAAGWIVPAKYYQQVGSDGFKQKPIGAGPYKFVSQVAGESVEFEANPDYWRKTPSVKTLIIKALPENTTRAAALETGEVDAITGVLPLQRERILANPQMKVAPVQSSNYWLEFPGFQKPTSPLNDKRVRQAVSLAINRKAVIDFHTGGLGENPGNWVTRSFPGAVELPPPEYNVAKAKQLLAEAGYPDGFDAGTMTPFPPNGPLGDFVMTQLREVGIRAKLNNMERAAYDQKRSEGPGSLPDGINLSSNASGTAGQAIRFMASCKGTLSQTCMPEIEERFQKYDNSVNQQERDQLLKEIQLWMADNYIFVPVLRNVFVDAQGPRITNKWEDIWGAMANWLYLGPYDDLVVKD